MKRLMLLALAAIALLVPLTPVSADDCDGISLADCADRALECPTECASRCIQTDKGQFTDFPEYCATCQKISIAGSPIPGLSALLNLNCARAGADAIEKKFCDHGPACKDKGCIETTKEYQVDFGSGKQPCTDQTESCPNGKIHYSCCICDQTVDGKVKVTMMTPLLATRTSCEQVCNGLLPKGTLHPGLGASTLAPPPSALAPTAQEIHQVNALCFTPAECASAEYGGRPDAFRPGHGCEKGKGRCVAPEPDVELSYPIGGISTVTGYRGFVATVFKFLMVSVATVAAVMFLWGGFRYIFGAAFQSVQRGKEIMIDAAIGLLLSLGAMTILQTINPATLNLTKLDVFMINKQQVLSEKFCANAAGKLEFAEAGVSPAFTPVSQLTDANFSIKDKNETKCGVDYYVKGFGDSRCAGRKCDGGSACIPCASGACKAGADPKGSECITANFAGGIKYTNSRYVENISLLYVCKDALTKPDPIKTQIAGVATNNIAELKAGKLIKSEAPSGDQAYTFEFTEQDIENARKDCETNENGLVGFVLGIEYNDPGILETVTTVSGLEDDEYAIIGKQNCGSGKFVAYAGDDTYPKTLAFSSLHMETALACGLQIGPLKSASHYWTYADLEASLVGGDPKPIFCHFQLSTGNAPSNPVASGKNVVEMDLPPLGNVRCPVF